VKSDSFVTSYFHLFHDISAYFTGNTYPSSYSFSKQRSSVKFSCFGGVVVCVLAIGPKVRGLKPGRGDGFLKAI
jgi:hypothetical protein